MEGVAGMDRTSNVTSKRDSRRNANEACPTQPKRNSNL